MEHMAIGKYQLPNPLFSNTGSIGLNSTSDHRLDRAGTAQRSVAERRQAFVHAYMANRHNATQAAITAGYSPKTAYSQGQRLLKAVEKSGELAAAAREASFAPGLTTERTLLELKRIALSDIRGVFNPDGSIKSLAEMDEDTSAAIASIEVVTRGEGDKKRVTTKVKLWDKISALDQVMRHLGLFEPDNKQGNPLKIDIELIGGP